MRRTSAPGHAGNRFSAGNPGLGILPTELDPDWHNSVQEEIANVIENEDGGDTLLDEEDEGQLLAAIQAIVAREIGAVTGVHVTQLGEAKVYFHKPPETQFYKLANRQTLARASYPELEAALTSVVGNPWLAVNEAAKNANPSLWWIDTVNNLIYMPDQRGQFWRVDPADMAAGGVVRPTLGRRKAHTLAAHSHDVDQGQISGTGSGPIASGDDWTATVAITRATSSTGGDETVPDHTSIYVLIRVK